MVPKKWYPKLCPTPINDVQDMIEQRISIMHDDGQLTKLPDTNAEHHTRCSKCKYLFAFILLAILQIPVNWVISIKPIGRSKGGTNPNPNPEFDAAYQMQMTSNKSSGVPLLYAADPYKFASAFTSCMTDPSCRIMYNHIQKTGGSYLASRLHPVLDENGRKYVSKKWCCDTGLWNRFANQTNHFCGLKFGLYETGVPMFANIIETCQQHTKKRKREIALITIRDPIKRTLSRINMRCNRSYRR